MALLLSNIHMPVSSDIGDIPGLIAEEFQIPGECIQAVRLVRKSIDARRKRDIHFNISVVVQCEPLWQARLMKRGDSRTQLYVQAEPFLLPQGSIKARERIAVVGMGPAGLFAAYVLAQAGYHPILIERGQPVRQRSEDVENFWQGKGLNEESNVMFGEGGAGLFSDGKLTARSKDPRVETVLKIFAEHGAPEDIVYMAKPHIGTDQLRDVIKKMREAILAAGGEVRFQTKLCDLHVKDGALHAIQLQKGSASEKLPVAACILATGQAARDTYEMLHDAGIMLAAKPFAVGLRIEHPQALIDRVQYGDFAGNPRLGAAEYGLAAKVDKRGVYTFCMCPGGQVIAASSGREEVVVNGMSLRSRAGENANAAVVVQVGPEDFQEEGALGGMRFQQALERQAFLAGEKTYMAPAQRVEDFLLGRQTAAFSSVQPSYRPGVVPYGLDAILPEFVSAGIKKGITEFSRQMQGFALPDAVLTGMESRTSAPVRILRDERFESVNIAGLYPAGEGAGYAGGIVSAAVDGLRAASCLAARFAPGMPD